MPAVRGAAPGADATDHHCGKQLAELARHGQSRELGFRCAPAPQRTGRRSRREARPGRPQIALDPAQLGEVRDDDPAAVDPSIDPLFLDPDDPATVLKRGKTPQGPPDTEGFTLTTSPLLWNPAPGEEVVVVLGRSAKDSFIVALYKLPDNRYRLASSLLLVNDLGPFALAYHPEVRERLLWSSCWKCAGEGGAVSLRDGRRVIIVQQ